MEEVKEIISDSLKANIEMIKAYVESSRESSLVITKLEEALMWLEKSNVKEP